MMKKVRNEIEDGGIKTAFRTAFSVILAILFVLTVDVSVVGQVRKTGQAQRTHQTVKTRQTGKYRQAGKSRQTVKSRQDGKASQTGKANSGQTVKPGQEWLWPMAGKEKGSAVLYKPQNYIDRELNFSSLFVGGKEGDAVIAPFTGKVGMITLTYMDALTYSRSSDIDFNQSFEKTRQDFVKNSRRTAQYVSHSINIASPDGRRLNLTGLKLKRKFRSGEKVNAGDTLGTLAYSYYKVPVPALMIDVSLYSKPSDPMAPFGLKSTFKEQEPLKKLSFLTPAQVKEDLNALTEIITDCYPSLDEIISKENLKGYMDSEADAVKENMDMMDFMMLMTRVSAFVHDSHISFWPSWGVGKRSTWNLFLSLVGDSVRITRASDGMTGYLGRKVISIDGIGTDLMARRLSRFVSDYDAKSEGYIKLRLLWGFNGLYLYSNPAAVRKNGFNITLDNGETVNVKLLYERVNVTPGSRHLATVNRHEGGFATRMLNDSTAYLGLSTFSLDEVSVDSIREFIRRNLKTPHMIVDVRNNGGGSDEVLHRLLSYCSDRPYAKLRHRSKVNRRGHFPSMVYCRNYTSDSEIFGEEYVPTEGKDGLYSGGEETAIMPDPEVAYGGKLYVLVDEMSCSAATLFPANVLRSHRGVVIGRETRTAYGFMTALKFADFTLPNSKVNWRIPLVKCIFDETESPRIPRGRGVIPDVTVPFDDDYILGKRDVILERALRMIAEGEYLGENPF